MQEHVMEVAKVAENTAVNVGTAGIAMASSISSFFNIVEGVLPIVVMVITGACTFAFTVYHIKNGKKVDAERRLVEMKIRQMERDKDGRSGTRDT